MDTSLIYAAEWKGIREGKIMVVTGHEIKYGNGTMRNKR